MKYPCPCCGYLTYDYEPNGTFDICDICGWEVDDYQAKYPDSNGGANKVSLNQARLNFKMYGASDNFFRGKGRKPYPWEIPNL